VFRDAVGGTAPDAEPVDDERAGEGRVHAADAVTGWLAALAPLAPPGSRLAPLAARSFGGARSARAAWRAID
jgi:hypothetical protein